MPTSAQPSVRKLTWLVVQDSVMRDATEQVTLQRLKQATVSATVQHLAQRFGQLVRTRHAAALDGWFRDVTASGLAELKTVAKGLEQDLTAVRAALEQSTSNGQTKGQVNRLKLIKRQGYGRANFDLLRKRVLAAA